LKTVGSDAIPPDLLAAALPLVPVCRQGRAAWEAELPISELAAATFPKLVVSGGHHAGFEAICDDVAERIDATRMVIEGAGHEVQFTGPPLNEALVSLWSTTAAAPVISS